MFKVKGSLIILIIVLFVEIFLAWTIAEKHLVVPRFILAAGWVALILTIGVSGFFIGWYSALGKPAIYEDLKDGFYPVNSGMKKRVIEVMRRDNTDKRYLITDLPLSLLEILKTSELKGFEKRTTVKTETIIQQ